MSSYSNSKKKLKKSRKVPSGAIYISTTFNNIIVTATDLFGNVLVSSSAGREGLKGAKKSTPFAAQLVASSVAKDAIETFGMKTIVVIVKGPGAGKEFAIRSLATVGLIVTVITDVTPLPHNGCRRPKMRRV